VRRWTLLGIMAVACGALVARAVDQQIFETDFLQREGARRHLRVVEMPAHRGMILDRSGEPLAISTPVHSVWANPRELVPDRGTLAPLAEVLDMGVESLRGLLARRSDRAFVYLKRQVTPAVARAVTALDVPGVGLQREYRRYYPSGEVTAHLVGFTDIDDIGQEGMELAYDGWLRGEPGRKRVVRDGRARVVENIESIREPRPGRDLVLSIDRRLQFLAYRELKAAVGHNKARGGTAVILDVTTGEILAMVNQPSYNPNGSRSGLGGRVRNRALTDVFEPGSTMKPFTVSAALELGRFRSDTPVDTSPGVLRVGRNQVKDVRDYGLLDVAGVIRKSSNVGASKIALSLPPEGLWTTLQGFGFGELTAAAFPGEATGQLAPYQSWARFDQAALAFGYGISVTAVQLAQAYAVIAGDGLRRPVSLVRVDEPPAGERVLSAETARTVRGMLEAVVSAQGTAPAAAIAGYRVAGKTGTVKKAVSGGYADHRYRAVFAGMAPASEPRLVLVVLIDEPRAGKYYGGQVAAPVFSRIMAGALRLLNVTPDDRGALGAHLAGTPGVRP
jgi:cell division protein FtsI (penicillin-binding protein 3)